MWIIRCCVASALLGLDSLWCMAEPAGAYIIDESEPPSLDEVLRSEPDVAVFSALAVERRPLGGLVDEVWFEVIEVGRGDVPPRVYDLDVPRGQELRRVCTPMTSQYEVGKAYVFVSSVGTGEVGPLISGQHSDLADEAVDRGLVSSPSFKWGMFGLMVAMAAAAMLVLSLGHRRQSRTS